MNSLEKLKNYSWLINMVLVCFVFLKQCGVSRDQDKIQKNLKEITLRVDSIPSSQEIQKRMNETMFNFLIYENDFDSKKTSLSEIRSKLDATK